MEYYYHVYLKYKDNDGTEHDGWTFGYTKDSLEKIFSRPYNENRPFIFVGYKLYPSNVVKIRIFQSLEQNGKKIILPNGKNVLEETDYEYVEKCFGKKLVTPDVWGVTPIFIFPSDTEKNTTKRTEEKTNRKIFIVHGKDEASAFKLKDHLVKKGINAEMFEDFKERIIGNTTVIEELIKIKDEISYAFVIATADDLGNLCEEIEDHINGLVKGKTTVEAKDVCSILDKLNFRARQNVLFEYGLFLGVLGREKVECLWDKKIGEEPSDIKGVLNIKFEKSIKETFLEIDGKLDKIKE